jgi:hypothetical protein
MALTDTERDQAWRRAERLRIVLDTLTAIREAIADERARHPGQQPSRIVIAARIGETEHERTAPVGSAS